MSDHARTRWAQACAGITVFSATSATAIWIGASGKGSTLPAWPAIVFAVIALAGVVGWLLAAFQRGPFKPPPPPPMALPEAIRL